MYRTLAICLLLANADAALAQDAASRTAEIDAQTNLTKAETARITAEADLARARVSSLGLPSFEGKTTLEGEAGKMETMQMASYALGDAAGEIVKAVFPGAAKRPETIAAPDRLILLTMSEPFDLSLADSIDIELKELSADLDKAVKEGETALERNLALSIRTRTKPRADKDGPSPLTAVTSTAAATTALAATANPVALAVAGIGAVAGLMRSETTVNGFGISEMDDAMLVRTIIRLRPGYLIVPSAIAVTPTGSPLLKTLNEASELSDRGRQLHGRIVAKAGKTPNAVAIRLIDALDLAIKRFNAFHVRVVTANAAGRLPIIEAARAAGLRNHKVLRVHVDRAGGSLVNTKNIATFFGVDPIKITAGLVTSYVVSDPVSGVTGAAGIITCRTTMTRLRRVQEGDYSPYKTSTAQTGSKYAVCTPLA